MMNKAKSNSLLAHIPGSNENVAGQHYYERGSQTVIENLFLKKPVFSMLASNIILAISLVVMLPLKSVEIVKVTQDKNDRIHIIDEAGSQSSRTIADEAAQLAWVADWSKDVFEINAATWQKNFKRAVSRTAGTAKDQLQDYWTSENNNPTKILTKDRDFVRELERLSINTIQPNVILIRFRLISRTGDGTKTTKVFATTVSLKTVMGKTREEIIDNPSGLIAQSVSISDESK